MAGSVVEEDKPEIADVLSALNDDDCRDIIRNTDKSLSAKELIDKTDIPKSTLYRKLEDLSDATLLSESMKLRKDGKHTSVYTIGFERIILELNDERELEIEISRPRESPDERIESMWREVGREI